MRPRLLPASLLIACLLVAAPARAQVLVLKQPLPRVTLDVSGAVSPLGADAATAGSLGVATTDLRSRALGWHVGVNLYLLRGASWALGVAGEYVRVTNSRQPTDSSGTPFGPRIDRRLAGPSGQVTLNFGHRTGWSYLSGGLGPMKFDTYYASTTPDRVASSVINYGGGARWFTSTHLAFALDLRFYATPPVPGTVTTAGRNRHRVMVFSVGISIK